MSPVDIEYFDFFMRSSMLQNQLEEELDEISMEDELDEMFQRMQYVVDEIGYQNTADERAANAMERRRKQEQDVRNSYFQKAFLKMMGKPSKKEVEAIRVPHRTENAHWHVSYFGDEDRKWKEVVMKELGCNSYTLYPSIDECISRWRKG